MKQFIAALLCALMLMLLPLCALAQYDAFAARSWLEQFAMELSALQPLNDVKATADPARPGEYLLEYAFGTVIASSASAPAAHEILRVELTTGGVRDCRGLSVGQDLESVLSGREVPQSGSPLYVLSVQEEDGGFSWAYVGAQGVYGVEFIAYDYSAQTMKEYTLTYVIDGGVISAIRMQMADATQALAQESMRTAREIAQRQQGELVALENEQSAFIKEDMTVSYRRAVGVPVDELISVIGEPQEIQVLPDGDGRMLEYAFCAAELLFDEMTGVEFVRSITCVVPGIAGPRGVQVGMDAMTAAALFRCDNSVYASGGTLYLAGEAQGIAPYGEVLAGSAGQYTLRYACEMGDRKTGVLNIGVTDGVVTHWNLLVEETEAAYGG